MTNPLDFELDDPELVSEIALVADLMAAATDTPGQLSQATIDRILQDAELAGG